MNDRDRLEAINYADNSKLSNNNVIQYAIQIEAFISGCEYKQKELEQKLLEFEADWVKMRDIAEKTQAENDNLKKYLRELSNSDKEGLNT